MLSISVDLGSFLAKRIACWTIKERIRLAATLGDMITTALLLVGAATAWAACPYEIKNIKIDPCNGEPVKLWDLKNLGAEFTDKCDVRIKGCVKLNTAFSNIKVNYKANKNGIEILKGSKDVCGIKLFDTKFDCPLPKDKDICTTENWVQELPKGMISMAAGNIKGQADVMTSSGKFCYKLSADIKHK